MESSINVPVSQGQLLFALVFQIWLIVFPIIIIRKMNFIIAMLQDKLYTNDDSQQES